ncbi:helix-turn-helix domain-containing protein [Streptomyces phytohabitans]|uniref:helix-turn-helix domain-containing protein n=1 Tax=Streptomyces phytohabitans TaxID=1150371 RepID=UPI00345B9DB6
MPDQPPLFGPELRGLRLSAGLSLTRLSQLVHYSKSQLSKVERGLKAPCPQLARLCDAALNAHGRLAALVPEEPAATEPTETNDDGEVWIMQLSPDGASWFRPVNRRQVVAAGAAAGVSTAFGLGIGPAAASAPAVGATLLDCARTLFDQYRRMGQTSSPQLVLPALIAQTHTLRELAERSRSRTRDGLLTLASRYAEYVGWLTQEAGDEKAALWWTDRAVELAAAGGDHDLAAYALVRRALVTFYRGDAPRTVALAQQAQGDARLPRILGLAAQREGQGHALAGDYDACIRCLDRARVLLTHDAPDPSGPVIGTTSLSDPVAMVTGWCLHDLGRPGDAAEVIARELSQVPSYASRSRARYGMRQAVALAASGEIDHACALAGELLTSADAVGSATIRADLRQLARTLTRHAGNESVRALAPRLAASLHSSAP